MNEQPMVRIRRKGQPVQEFVVVTRTEDYEAGLTRIEVRPAWILRALRAIREAAPYGRSDR